ncbi:MAG TPA: glycogen/starch synthase, partial [Candidatus Acidoferrales bacterium]
MRILFVASEGLPFSKTGGLADVIEALPKALVEMGNE